MRKFYLVAIWVALGFAMTGCTDDIVEPTAPSRNLDIAGVIVPLAPGNVDGDGDGIYDADEERLARQYRPAWAYDDLESWFPISMNEWALLGRWVGSPA